MSTDPLIGARLGQYEVIERIGSGGYASVYRAKQLNLDDRIVALKLLQRVGETAEERSQRLRYFRREAKLLAHLQHPNILSVFDAGEDEGRLWIAMPLIAGGPLTDHLNEYREAGESLPAEQIVRIVRQIGEALDCVHAQGIVHRDVKPSNVLVGQSLHCFLADFGIGKLVDAGNTQSIYSPGTPKYMSPEQIQSKEIDGRSDLYSLGCMTYEMIVGEAPFEANDTSALLYKHVHEAVVIPEEVRARMPEGVPGVIERALHKDPAERYGSGTALAAALEAALKATRGGETELVGKPAAPESPPAPAGSRAKPILLTLLVLAAAVGIAWWVTREDQDAQRTAARGEDGSETVEEAGETPTADTGGTDQERFGPNGSDETKESEAKAEETREQVAEVDRRSAVTQRSRPPLPVIERREVPIVICWSRTKHATVSRALGDALIRVEEVLRRNYPGLRLISEPTDSPDREPLRSLSAELPTEMKTTGPDLLIQLAPRFERRLDSRALGQAFLSKLEIRTTLWSRDGTKRSLRPFVRGREESTADPIGPLVREIASGADDLAGLLEAACTEWFEGVETRGRSWTVALLGRPLDLELFGTVLATHPVALPESVAASERPMAAHLPPEAASDERLKELPGTREWRAWTLRSRQATATLRSALRDLARRWEGRREAASSTAGLERIGSS